MEDSFLIKPSSKEVFVSANQKRYQNYAKNRHQKTNNDDNSLKYLPKMHNVYRLSSKARSEPDLYGNQNYLTIYLLESMIILFTYLCTNRALR